MRGEYSLRSLKNIVYEIMNSLLLLDNEFKSDHLVIIRGVRALELIKSHDLKEGIEIAVARFGGGRGRGFVRKCVADSIELDINLSLEPLAREHTHLIVAVPRPQTVKKVLHIAACTGIESVDFIPSFSVQKSYLQSKSLNAEMIEREIFLGLQQANDSIAPAVRVHKSFNIFMEDFLPNKLPSNDSTIKVCAHTEAVFSKKISDFTEDAFRLESGQENILLAIGPEAGWTDREAQCFKGAGFSLHSLGERIYRVETALTLLLGQIMLTRKQKIKEHSQ